MILKGNYMFAAIYLLSMMSCGNVSIQDIVGTGETSQTRYNIETLDNPVLPQDAADPSLLDDRERTGYYYLYTTENGECDIPVYRSKNLVNWEFVGDAFPDGFQRKWGESWARPWAPDINYINGKYVLYYSMGCWNEPMLSESGVAVSDSPEGPLLATLKVPLTGWDDRWAVVTADVAKVSGVHDLYFVCKGNKPGRVMYFDYWMFSPANAD